MVFDGFQVTPEALLGQPGDYLRQLDCAAGAWRTSAITLGGLEALLVRGTLIELLFRDLAMYLCHPAPAESLAEAAAHFMQRALPEVPDR